VIFKSNFLQKCLFITVSWYSQSPEVNMHFCIKWMSFWKSTVPKQSCVGGCQHSMFRSTGWWLSPLPSTRMDFCHSSFVTFILQSVVFCHFSTFVIPLTKFVGNDGRKFFFLFWYHFVYSRLFCRCLTVMCYQRMLSRVLSTLASLIKITLGCWIMDCCKHIFIRDLKGIEGLVD